MQTQEEPLIFQKYFLNRGSDSLAMEDRLNRARQAIERLTREAGQEPRPEARSDSQGSCQVPEKGRDVEVWDVVFRRVYFIH